MCLLSGLLHKPLSPRNNVMSSCVLPVYPKLLGIIPLKKKNSHVFHIFNNNVLDMCATVGIFYYARTCEKPLLSRL